MSLYNLKFEDHSLEKNFEDKYNKDSVLLARFGIIMASLLFSVYAFLDPYTYPNSYQTIYVIRFTTAFLLFLLFITSFYVDFAKYLQKISFFQFLISAVGLITLCSFPQESNYQLIYMASYALLPVAAYIFLGFNFINATISVVISNTVMGLIILFNYSIVDAIFVLILYNSVTFISAITAYCLERSYRKMYVKIIVEDEIREELESTKKELESTNKVLENLSVTDELTGLKNRRFFNEILLQESKRAQRNQSSLGFMMIDIDQFKTYNDTYGHLEGDEVLKNVSKLFNEKVKRSGDFVFRLGGEEFGILITDTNAQECQQLASSLCRGIEELKIEHKNSSVIKYLTISIGISIKYADDIDTKALIKEADNALYKAKESGRNQYLFLNQEK